MPREVRKRGRRNRAKTREEAAAAQAAFEEQPEEERDAVVDAGDGSTPSWVKAPASEQRPLDYSEIAPWGFVDPEVKAYFRTVGEKLKEYAEQEEEMARAGAWAEEEDKVEVAEDQKLFVKAALNELQGKELQLATDPDCSIVLERLLYAMDDVSRRVFMDSLSGNYEALTTHRFASHVCQTLFTLSSSAIEREVFNGVAVPRSERDDIDTGTLRTAQQLFLDACEELRPSLPILIQDPFASHVLRVALLILSLKPVSPSSDPSSVRSKKSAKFKAKEVSMRLLTAVSGVDPNETQGKTKGKEGRKRESQKREAFREELRTMVDALVKDLGENEARALTVSPVASPTLQMLLEVEAEQGKSGERGSLMDRVTGGLIASIEENPGGGRDRTDYLESLLRDQTASHAFERIVSLSPDPAFDVLWRTYFSERLVRLGTHPVANFVVAEACKRLSGEQLTTAVGEVGPGIGKLVKASRLGPVKALIDRAAVLGVAEGEIIEAVCDGFGLSSAEERKVLVPCLLTLQTHKQWMKRVKGKDRAAEGAEDEEETQDADGHQDEDTGADAEAARAKGRGGMRNIVNDRRPTSMQGSLVLQSLLNLSAPHSQIVLESLLSLDQTDLRSICCDQIGCHVVIASLRPAGKVSPKARKQLVSALLSCLYQLAEDKFGSRVADAVWDGADLYFKDKVAAALAPRERQLLASPYGRFFIRRVNLNLYRRRYDEWRESLAKPITQATAIASSAPSSAPVPPQVPSSDQAAHAKESRENAKKRPAESEWGNDGANDKAAEKGKRRKKDKKRRSKAADEIDQVFKFAKAARLSGRTDAAALPTAAVAQSPN